MFMQGHVCMCSVCMCAFTGCMGDTQFHFRVRCTGSGAGGSDLDPTHRHYGAPLVLMVRPSRNQCILS